MSRREPWGDLLGTVLRGLMHARAHKIVITAADPDRPGTVTTVRESVALDEEERRTLSTACSAVHRAARKAGVDETALALEIASAIKKGAYRARVTRTNRQLDPTRRKQYRAQSAAARGLAQFLAEEINAREILPDDNDNPTAFAALLRHRAYAQVQANDRGASIEEPTFSQAMARAVGAINDLHWLAEILREDSDCARPEGRRRAAWIGTATRLRALFEEWLGAPLVDAVAALAGLAHKCVVPAAKVSHLTKP